jgi:hypothetical protein
MSQPHPGGPKHRHRQRLHVARWDVDDQPLDLAPADRLEVRDDGLDVPVGHVGAAWLDHRPGLGHELAQALAAQLGLDLIQTDQLSTDLPQLFGGQAAQVEPRLGLLVAVLGLGAAEGPALPLSAEAPALRPAARQQPGDRRPLLLPCDGYLGHHAHLGLGLGLFDRGAKFAIGGFVLGFSVRIAALQPAVVGGGVDARAGRRGGGVAASRKGFHDLLLQLRRQLGRAAGLSHRPAPP